jgi:hypothetical protein
MEQKQDTSDDCKRCKKYRKLAYILYRQLQSHDEYKHWGRVHVNGKGSELMKELGMCR